ncbi:UNVERIFIED_CONTAM: hypothetical protein NCL1_20059 [Trichonephila clavipes]
MSADSPNEQRERFHSPEAVCLPGSKAAVPITQVAPVLFAVVRLPDENGSPVRDGRVINGRDEISPESSPSINLTVPVPAFPLTIPDDHVLAFPLITPNDPVPASPLTVPDDPEPEEGDLGDSSPDKRTIKTRFGRVVRPVNKLKI